METARDKVEISLNKKTGVITISVTDQDQVICQMMADSVQQLLQVYITDYRTSKARSDMDYYEQLARQAKQEMKQAQQAYADYYDTHTGITMQSVRQQLNELETDLQLCQNAYTTINSQLQAARAKVQERTPAFTVIKGAAVPVQPAGPKRMFFVAGILFLSVIGTIIYILKDDLLKPFLKNTAETTENGSC